MPRCLSSTQILVGEYTDFERRAHALWVCCGSRMLDDWWRGERAVAPSFGGLVALAVGAGGGEGFEIPFSLVGSSSVGVSAGVSSAACCTSGSSDVSSTKLSVVGRLGDCAGDRFIVICGCSSGGGARTTRFRCGQVARRCAWPY